MDVVLFLLCLRWQMGEGMNIEEKREQEKKIWEYITHEIINKAPYYKQLPFVFKRLSRGLAILEFRIVPKFVNTQGIASGGILASFCDSVMGMACRTLGHHVTTLEINMNYIRPISVESRILGVGKVLREGTRTVVVECEFFNERTELVVKGRASFYILQKDKKGN